MKKEALIKDIEFKSKVLSLLNKLLPNKEPMRILTYEERELITKDALNYLFELRENNYLDDDKFEKIMLISTVISNITGEKNNIYTISDIVNFIFFIDNTDFFVSDVLDMMFSGNFSNVQFEEIN